MMEDYIIYVVITAVSFYAGWLYREWSASRRVNAMLAQIRENEDAIESSRIYATIEIKDGMIFMYNKETSAYLGHSENFTDLENTLKTKFPDTTFAISRDDMLKLMK